MGCHFLLQGIFPTLGSNPGLPHSRQTLEPLSHQGSPNGKAAAAAAAVASVMSDSVRPHRQQPTRLPRPWGSPGKNTGVGCHFLLQCIKVKTESGVTQSCPTLSDPMDCSLPGSSVHGIFQAHKSSFPQGPAQCKRCWRVDTSDTSGVHAPCSTMIHVQTTYLYRAPITASVYFLATPHLAATLSSSQVPELLQLLP